MLNLNRHLRIVLFFRIIIFIIVMFSVLILFANSKNSLSERDTFIGPHVEYEKHLHPTNIFWQDTGTLKGGRLNFGSDGWLFAELFTLKSYDFDTIELYLMMKESSLFYLFYSLSKDKDFNNREAVRFVCDDLHKGIYKSGFFKISESRVFREVRPEEIPINCNEWNRIKFIKHEKEQELYVNETRVKVPSPVIEGGSQVGFLGGIGESSIDQLRLLKNGEVIFYEDFSYQFKTRDVLFAILVALAFVLTIWFVTLQFKDGERHLWEVVFNIVVLISGSAVLITSSFTNLNYDWTTKIFQSTGEQNESVVPYFVSKVENRISKFKEGDLNIALVGSSQTYGVGSEYEDTTIAAFLKRELERTTHRRIEVFPLAIPGATSGVLFESWSGPLRKIRPQMIILNLSNNDYAQPGFDVQTFGSNLEKFISLAREFGAKIVFIKEPIFFLNESKISAPAYLEMDEIGKRYNIPVVDMNKQLVESGRYDSGILWADTIHMTGFGQKTFVELLLPFCREELRLNDI